MGDFQFYHYTPTLAGAIIFGVVFLILFIFNLFIIFQSRSKAKLYEEGTPSYMIEVEKPTFLALDNVKSFRKQILPMFVPLIIGIFMEAVGYFARAKSHADQEKLTPYIIQSILLLIAPSFIAATVYMIFGRMMRLLDASNYSILKFKYQTTFFVTGDVFSFLLQAGGGGMMAQSGNQDLGSKIVIGGLVVQLLFLFVFVISEIKFTYLMRRNPTTPSYGVIQTRAISPFSWNMLNTALIVSSILIIIRCIVRLVEFAQGFDGFIISHEVFLYTLDGLLMIIVSFILIFVRPELVMFDLMNLK